MAKAKIAKGDRRIEGYLLDDNPQVDGRMLIEVLEVIDGLRNSGIVAARYNLSSPFASRQQITRTNSSRAATLDID